MKERIKSKGLNLVSIGSISAASLVINSFPEYKKNITAIVPTTDTGSSTGIIREKFNLPAPGDIRAVLTAFAGDKGNSGLWKKIFEYRLKPQQFKELSNLALGNLILAVLTEILGDFGQAVKKATNLIGAQGKVIPVTITNTHLQAELENGRIVVGEKYVRQMGKSPIKKLYLTNSAVKLGEGLEPALQKADIIIIGPGCLFTSIIACLVVPGVPDLLAQSPAKKVFCCNLTTTPGQTDGFSVYDHVSTLIYYLGHHPPDYVLINRKKPRPEVIKAYEEDNLQIILPTSKEIKKIKATGTTPLVADLIEENWMGKRKLHKLDSIRHDPKKVRHALISLLSKYA